MSDPFKTQGAFSWCELATTDLSGSIKFYTELLGWEVEAKMLTAGMQYNLLKAGGKEIGGIMSMPPHTPKGTPAVWGTFVTVDDVPATSKKAEKLGAKIVVPIINIPQLGQFCIIQDPQGGIISLIDYSKKIEY